MAITFVFDIQDSVCWNGVYRGNFADLLNADFVNVINRDGENLIERFIAQVFGANPDRV